jgi:EAL domain-containing protein (putative c-di-GMP-specific phosphodiesterase class I)
VGFGNNGLAKANLHGANDQKVLAGGDRESVGAGFTDSGNSEGRCIGAEALIRWFHPQKGLISPGDFIPIAEEIGLIGVLGKEVLRKVCVQMAEWKKIGFLENLEVSVNVSPAYS